MRKLETKRRRKWIKFKNKRLTTCSNLGKESNNGVTSSKEVEISPVNIVSSNKDQQGNFPSAEQLSFITNNRHQRKKNRTYTDAVVNIPDDPAVSSTTNELPKSRLGNKTVLVSEELRGIYYILMSIEPKVVETLPPFLSTDASIFENTRASCKTDGLRQEVASKNNSVSRLGVKLPSILVDLQNNESNEDFAIDNLVVISEGLPTKATISDEGCLVGSFFSKTVFILNQRASSDIETQVLEKGLDFSPVRRYLNEPELRKDFEEFARKMRIKWNFRSKPSEDFSDKPKFCPKSNTQPPPGCSSLELF